MNATSQAPHAAHRFQNLEATLASIDCPNRAIALLIGLLLDLLRSLMTGLPPVPVAAEPLPQPQPRAPKRHKSRFRLRRRTRTVRVRTRARVSAIAPSRTPVARAQTRAAQHAIAEPRWRPKAPLRKF